MHSTTQDPVIWTKEPVYWDSPLGNLDRTHVGETLRGPLQEGFHSDSQRGFPITVHGQTTLPAPVEGIIPRAVPIAHCTAVRAPLRSVVSINLVERDLKHHSIRAEELPEPCIRNPIDFPVSFFVKQLLPPPEVFKLLDSDRRIISAGEAHDFPGYLTAPRLNEVPLLAFKPPQVFLGFFRALISMGLELSPPLKIPPLPQGNIPAEVELPHNHGGLSIEDGYGGESRGADINSYYKSPIIPWFRKFFFKNHGDSTIFEESDAAETPSIGKEGIEPLGLIIKFNRDYKGLAGGVGDFKAGVASLGFNEPEPSLIKPDGAFPESTVYRVSPSPSILAGFLHNIAGEEGGPAYA